MTSAKLVNQVCSRHHLVDLAFFTLCGSSERLNNLNMTKTLDHIQESVRSTKHPFRATADRPAKAQKHRYERRKIKQYLQLGEWDGESEMAA